LPHLARPGDVPDPRHVADLLHIPVLVGRAHLFACLRARMWARLCRYRKQ
jgi:hypothetical protein